MVFHCDFIKLPVVNTYTLPVLYTSGDHNTFVVLDYRDSLLLWYHLHRAHPIVIRQWIDHSRINNLQYLFLYNFIHGQIQPSLCISNRLAFIFPKSLMHTSRGKQQFNVQNFPTHGFFMFIQHLEEFLFLKLG